MHQIGDMAEKRREPAGVITAFFSMILLLVIVMITTMTETARVTACSRMSEIFLEISTKSLLAGYHLPLFENYHVFGKWVGEGNKEERLSEELRWYLEKNMSGITWMNMQPGEVRVTQAVPLTDNNGAPFYEQVQQYMKYRGAGLAVESLLEAAGIVKVLKEDILAVQKNLEYMESVSRAEGTLMQLFGCVDGFRIDGQVIDIDWRGKAKTVENFAKKLVAGGVSRNKTIEGNEELFKLQKKNYVDPVAACEHILSVIDMISEEQNMLYLSYSQEKELQEKCDSQKKFGTLQDTLKERLEKLQKEIVQRQEKIAQMQQHCRDCLLTLDNSIKGTKSASEQARELLGQLKEELEAAVFELEEYELWLGEQQEKVSPELFEELQKENQANMDSLRKKDSFGIMGDVAAFEKALSKNISLLEEAEKLKIRDCLQPQTGQAEWNRILQAYAGIVQKLETESLRFDYGKLLLPKQKNGYAGMLASLADYGLAGLVTGNQEGLSAGSIKPSECPSDGYTGEQSKQDTVSLTELLKTLAGGRLEEIPGLLGDFFLQEAEALTEEVCYLTYLTENFSSYVTVTAEETKKHESLDGIIYQLEYILAGKSSDVSNLNAVLYRLFLIRFLICFVSLYSSQECRAQLKAAAAAIVGVTGIGALILLTEAAIAILWAAECAAVETAVLVRGGELAFFTAAARLPVAFEELLSFGRTMLEVKVEQAGSAAGILKNYEQYLILFLFLEKGDLRTLRTMDVVQQQLRLSGQKDFFLRDCIYMLSAELNTVIPGRFLAAPFGAEKYIKYPKYAISY